MSSTGTVQEHNWHQQCSYFNSFSFISIQIRLHICTLLQSCCFFAVSCTPEAASSYFQNYHTSTFFTSYLLISPLSADNELFASQPIYCSEILILYKSCYSEQLMFHAAFNCPCQVSLRPDLSLCSLLSAVSQLKFIQLYYIYS